MILLLKNGRLFCVLAVQRRLAAPRSPQHRSLRLLPASRLHQTFSRRRCGRHLPREIYISKSDPFLAPAPAPAPRLQHLPRRLLQQGQSVAPPTAAPTWPQPPHPLQTQLTPRRPSPASLSLLPTASVPVPSSHQTSLRAIRSFHLSTGTNRSPGYLTLKKIGHFSIQNYHFSGAILHPFCIFSRTLRKLLAFIIAIRYTFRHAFSPFDRA